MRSIQSAALVAFALVTAGTSALGAQQSQPGAAAARVVATYDIRNQSRDIALPRSVTVADSAGTIIAHVTIEGERTRIPMQVTVLESDLVLQGQTTQGVLTLVLDRQNEGGATRMSSGRWMLGSTEGTLRARHKR